MPKEKPQGSRSRYLPALDGIRALAVVAVVLYHLNFTWIQGGLLGVTMFFVISGYIITRLLLNEFEQSGRIDLKSFWIRRARRLLPAIGILMVVTIVLCTFFNHVMLTKMRPDILPSLFFVNNWWQIAQNVSYFDALGDPSPLTHFWSLAIEEQFYLIWPPLLLGLLSMHVKKPTVRRMVLGLGAASALAMTLLYNPAVDPSRIYYGTDTRVFSLLLGVWLAFIPPRDMSPARLAHALGLDSLANKVKATAGKESALKGADATVANTADDATMAESLTNTPARGTIALTSIDLVGAAGLVGLLAIVRLVRLVGLVRLIGLAGLRLVRSGGLAVLVVLSGDSQVAADVGEGSVPAGEGIALVLGSLGGGGILAVGHGLGIQGVAGETVHEGDGEGDGLELGPDGVAGGQLAEGVAADSAHALAVHQHVGEDIALVGGDGVGGVALVVILGFAGGADGAVFSGGGGDGDHIADALILGDQLLQLVDKLRGLARLLPGPDAEAAAGRRRGR